MSLGDEIYWLLDATWTYTYPPYMDSSPGITKINYLNLDEDATVTYQLTPSLVGPAGSGNLRLRYWYSLAGCGGPYDFTVKAALILDMGETTARYSLPGDLVITDSSPSWGIVETDPVVYPPMTYPGDAELEFTLTMSAINHSSQVGLGPAIVYNDNAVGIAPRSISSGNEHGRSVSFQRPI